MEELELKGLNEKIYVYHTKCGLPIYMWVNEKVSSMYASLSVKYGSIHTKFKIGKKTYEVPNGIAHFLEHVKFNIDEETTAHDEFYKLGGDANAFTTFDYTSYIVFATNNKKENLEELLNFVYNPFFTKKCISKEKGIIVEEANMGLDDPYSIVFFHSLLNTLQKSKYRNTITGTPDDVTSITLEDVKLVYDTFYHPENMFLTLTGNFNPYEMACLVEDNLSKKKFGKYLNPIIIKENEPKKVTTKYKEEYINVTYPRLKFSIKMDMSRFKNYSSLELKILTNLLFNINFGATSDFKDELMEKGLIQNMNVTCDVYDDTFVVTINVTSNFKEEIIKKVKEKLENLSISELDFKRKKNATIATLILDYEDLENVSYRIQDDVLNNGGIVTNLKEILEDETIDDLKNIINLLDFDNISINVFLPKENQKEQ
ncbi:MAG: insulinase family protein [Firmicutes bacterium]|nr:insulinase family protein [Bacillota bacterium]